MNYEARGVGIVIYADTEITQNYGRASIGKDSSQPKLSSSRNKGSDHRHWLSAVRRDSRWYAQLRALGRRASQWIGLAVSSKKDRLWERNPHHLKGVQGKQCPQRRTSFQ